MHLKNKSTIRYVIFIAVFAGILVIPAFLTCIYKITGKSFDRELKGNYDAVYKPEFSAEKLVNGELTGDIESYVHNTFQGRGIFITTYNQIKHSVFNENSSDYIGKDLVSDGYIKASLGIDELDESNPENSTSMKEFVSRLVEINNELNNRGKQLIVMRALNKADYLSENIPRRYYLMKNKDSIGAGVFFDSLMKESGVPYFNTKEFVDELDMEYPIFYKSSHHWSRPVEAQVENRLFEIVEEVSGSKMERYSFSDVIAVDFPLDRDGDVLDLINIWTDTNEMYYRYVVEPDIPDEPVNICIQGDSFTTLICQDMVTNGHNGVVTNIFYDEMLYEGDFNTQQLNHDFSNVDFDYLVNNNDVFVICYTDNNLCFYGYGYTEALLSYLKG